MKATLPRLTLSPHHEAFTLRNNIHHYPTRPEQHMHQDIDAQEFAQTQHGRVLLNCYAREVAMQEHNLAVRAPEHTREVPPALRNHRGQILDIQLPRLHSRLCVGVQQVSVTGNYEYSTAIYLQTPAHPENHWKEASWRDLADLIISDLSQRENTPYNHDLLSQIEESIDTMQHFMEARGAGQPGLASQTPLQKYIASEQHLLTGHPFHPTPKSRSGWTRTEEKLYSPEHGSRLQLRYFQLPRAWIISDSLDGAATDQLLSDLTGHGLPAAPGHTIVPLHPWQADWLLRQPRIVKAVQEGDIKDLGNSGQHFYPTASIRTMLAGRAEAFLKLSLNLRITNCIRNNARHELAAALTASRLYRGMKAEMQMHFPYFHALEERAYLSMSFPDTMPGSEREHKEIEDGFGLVIREGLSAQLAHGITPMICASLFGNGQTGREDVANLIERYAHRQGLPLSQGMRLWFANYAELAIYPIFYLLFEKGIAFEPHMQNTIIGLGPDGGPARFILRDLELTRLTPRSHALTDGLEIDQKTRSEICCSDEAGWTRIGYCLLVNNICEVIATLANGNHDLYLDLWGCLRNVLQAYLARFPNPEAARRIQGLLSGEALPVKGNLLIRFLKQADRQAAYLPLYHPLGVVAGTRPLL